MSFILCLNLIFRPLRVIADKFNVLQMGMVASERVFKVLDNEDFIAVPIAIGTAEKAISPQVALKGKIDFDKVWFAYTRIIMF